MYRPSKEFDLSPPQVYDWIGGSLDPDAIARTREALRDAKILDMYTTGERQNSAYEALFDVDEVARNLVGLWVKDYDNLLRTYSYFEMKVPRATSSDLHDCYVRAWAILRIRTKYKQTHMMQGIAGSSGIWVMLPLETWTRNNGLIFQVMNEIRIGQYLIIDGRSPLIFLGSGGCLVICISLVV